MEPVEAPLFSSTVLMSRERMQITAEPISQTQPALGVAVAPSRPAKNVRTLSVAFYISALVVFLLQIADYINFGVDDVFISLRVAENVAKGNGYVYNVGEFVEGYSNWLWVTMLAVFGKMGYTQDYAPHAFLWVAKIMSLLFGIGTILLAARLGYKIAKRAGYPAHLVSSLLVLALCSCGPFVLWSWGGLETTQSAFLLTLAMLQAWYLIDRTDTHQTLKSSSLILLAVTFTLLALTRPEAILYGISGLLFLYLYAHKKIEHKKVVVSGILPFALLYAVFLVWRWTTYHDLLPNTFYAKTAGGLRSYGLSLKYLLGGIAFVTGPLLLAIPFAKSRRIASGIVGFLYAVLLTNFVFIAYSGGDWMAGYRFFVPIAPALLTLGIIGLLNLSRMVSADTSFASLGLKFYVFTIVMGLGEVFAARTLVRGQIQTMPSGIGSLPGHSVAWHEEIGDWFRANVHDHATVATGEAGMIGYKNPNIRILDLGGLLDRYIAQTKKKGMMPDVNYVFNQRPDFILIYNSGAAAETLKDTHPIPEVHSAMDYPGAVDESRVFHENYHLLKRFTSLDLYERNDRNNP